MFPVEGTQAQGSPVGATGLLYHIIRARRGARVGFCSGKAVEEAKMRAVRMRARVPASKGHDPGPNPKLGQGWGSVL